MTDTTLSDGAPGTKPEVAHAALTSLWVVIGLAMGPAVALGLARFAYALLFP